MSRFRPIFFDELRKRLQDECIRLAREFEDYLDGIPDKQETRRARALAMTNLEQTVHWIGVALKEDQLADEAQRYSVG